MVTGDEICAIKNIPDFSLQRDSPHILICCAALCLGILNIANLKQKRDML